MRSSSAEGSPGSPPRSRSLTGAAPSSSSKRATGSAGGRALSAPVADDGTHPGRVDLGASWIWSNEPLVQSYASALGAPLFAQHTRGDAMFEPRPGQLQRLQGNPIDGPATRFALGAQDLAERMAARLPEETIRLGVAVTAISADDRGVRVTSAAGSVVARHAVVAMPPPLAAERIAFSPPLPEELRRIAEGTAVWMGSMTKAVAVFARPLWRDAGLAGAAVSYAGPFREFHDLSGPDGRHAAIFGFAPSAALDGMSGAQAREAFRAQLESIFGETAARPLEIHLAGPAGRWRRHERLRLPGVPAAGAREDPPRLDRDGSGHGRAHRGRTACRPGGRAAGARSARASARPRLPGNAIA